MVKGTSECVIILEQKLNAPAQEGWELSTAREGTLIQGKSTDYNFTVGAFHTWVQATKHQSLLNCNRIGPWHLELSLTPHILFYKGRPKAKEGINSPSCLQPYPLLDRRTALQFKRLHSFGSGKWCRKIRERKLQLGMQFSCSFRFPFFVANLCELRTCSWSIRSQNIIKLAFSIYMTFDK